MKKNGIVKLIFSNVSKVYAYTSEIKFERDSLILISVTKLYPCAKVSENDLKKNIRYIRLNLLNQTKNFLDSFSESGDLDKGIWEPQFEPGNKILLTKGSNEEFYVVHISYLKSLYKIKNMERRKKIILRNSGRKIFNFCVEMGLLCEYKDDEKSFPIEGKGVPKRAVFEHVEFINDVVVDGKTQYYFKNCSEHRNSSKGHIKIYGENYMQYLYNNCSYDSYVGEKMKKYSSNKTFRRLKDLYVYQNLCKLIGELKEEDDYEKLTIEHPNVIYKIPKVGTQKDIGYNLGNLYRECVEMKTQLVF